MKKSAKLLITILVAAVFVTAMVPSAFAKEFAPKISENIGVNTQYVYSENDVSWIRQLTVKEDMLSIGGIIEEAILHPVTPYPYTCDAPHFKALVTESIKTYTLDEKTQRAAYLYVLDQIGALTIISEPTASNETKADWLRKNGIIVTPEDEADTERVLMISALYALMKNDFYYVIKGERLNIPNGTPMEEALVMHIAGLSNNSDELSAFMLKFFGTDKLGTLEDYIYYTSLMALYVNGYVTTTEIPVLDRDEVFRRVAIMTIRGYGISIDSENATQQEITDKYLTAMLGTHYEVSLDPESLIKARDEQSIPYYILQRMANEDANVTISHTRYTYEQCFDLVLKKTDRFDLEKEFYSDIYEYDVFLNATRDKIYINPTTLTGNARVSINGNNVPGGKYADIPLLPQAKQTINIECKYKLHDTTYTSNYKVNVHQGNVAPGDSNITGIIPTYGTTTPSTIPNTTPNVPVTNPDGSIVTNPDGSVVTTPSTVPNVPVTNPDGSIVTNPDGSIVTTPATGNVTFGQLIEIDQTLPAISPIISNINNGAMNVVGNILSVNEKGEIVDQNGNIISPEQLSQGYTYIAGDDGIIQVAFTDPTTEPVTEPEQNNDEENQRKLFMIAILSLCIILIVILIIVLSTSKNRKKSRKGKRKIKKK